jgi:hypothetical protein
VSIRQAEAYVNVAVTVKRQPFIDALVAFVVICQLSLSLMVNTLFVELLEVLYPNISQLLPQASKTIRKWIITAFEARKEVLKEELRQSISKIHFSFDLWTSPNHLALMGIVAHYIDAAGVNKSVSYVYLNVFGRMLEVPPTSGPTSLDCFSSATQHFWEIVRYSNSAQLAHQNVLLRFL